MAEREFVLSPRGYERVVTIITKAAKDENYTLQNNEEVIITASYYFSMASDRLTKSFTMRQMVAVDYSLDIARRLLIERGFDVAKLDKKVLENLKG
jgi:hypothetical protein